MPDLNYWERYWLHHRRPHRQQLITQRRRARVGQPHPAERAGDAYWHRTVPRPPVCPLG